MQKIMINNSNIHERLGHNKVDIISGGFMMNNKQAQFLDYILKRVQDGKVDEAQKLVNECFKNKKQEHLHVPILVPLFLKLQS